MEVFSSHYLQLCMRGLVVFSSERRNYNSLLRSKVSILIKDQKEKKKKNPLSSVFLQSTPSVLCSSIPRVGEPEGELRGLLGDLLNLGAHQTQASKRFF